MRRWACWWACCWPRSCRRYGGWGAPGLKASAPADSLVFEEGNTQALGALLYTEHLYAFEIAGYILLLAIIGAITLTLRRRRGLRVQQVSEQVAVRPGNRIRLVKMPVEKDE